MLHPFDTSSPDPAQRPRWMALLARAPVALLEAGLGDTRRWQVETLRPPESGLMMVQARAGGSAERFHLGEVSVTRCTLRLRTDEAAAPRIGVAYVMGRSHRQARLAALGDALLQEPALWPGLRERLLLPIQAHLAGLQAQREQAAASTRVEFFTVARQSESLDEREALDGACA